MASSTAPTGVDTSMDFVPGVRLNNGVEIPAVAAEPTATTLDARFENILDLIGDEIALCASVSQPTSGSQVTATVVEQPATIQLSVVMPCLNEADTLAACLTKARDALQSLGIGYEIIVADNGSTDASRAIAIQLGARVIDVPTRGYGAALMAGIAAAKGEFIVMGDADDSYDFSDIPKFYRKLASGAELAQGCRLASGGGRVMPDAMPWLHQYIGNPMLTWLANTMFRAPVHDVYCGMRGFRKDWYERLGLKCNGMEFAVEMIVKGTLFNSKIVEVPIRLHPDGRQSHRPHLRTFRDGWRTLRFFMLHSPRWTFLIPGLVLALCGLLGSLLALPQMRIGWAALDVHTLLVSMVSILVGTQVLSCGIMAKTIAVRAQLLPRHALLERLLNYWTLEKSLVCCGVMYAIGFALIGCMTMIWIGNGFGPLDYASSMRVVIPGVGLIALATQIASSSFLVGVVRMDQKQ